MSIKEISSVKIELIWPKSKISIGFNLKNMKYLLQQKKKCSFLNKNYIWPKCYFFQPTLYILTCIWKKWIRWKLFIYGSDLAVSFTCVQINFLISYLINMNKLNQQVNQKTKIHQAWLHYHIFDNIKHSQLLSNQAVFVKIEKICLSS